MKKIEPTQMQRQAVDNIVSGKFVKKSGKPDLGKAMRDAGYSQQSSLHPKIALAEKKGVQAYVEQLGEKAKTKWGMSMEDKVMDVYLEGLDAQKPFGKDAVLFPDHPTRKLFADRLAEFMGWVQPIAIMGSGNKVQNFNFFSLPEQKRQAFNTNFDQFLKKYYGV